MQMNTPENIKSCRDALGLFYESVLKPDHELRQCAHNQSCYHELMEWRDDVIPGWISEEIKNSGENK